MEQFATIAIFKDSKLLLLWRDDSGHYEIPGGPVKSGEVEEFAAIRESELDIGCPVQVIKKFMTIQTPDTKTHIYQGYLKENVKPKIMQPSVHSELAWVPIDEYQKFKLAPSVKAFCEKYLL